MAKELTGKCALVTGGSGEIGRALCVRLAECGAEVIFTFFSNHDGADETSKAIEAVGGRSTAIRAHLGKEKTIDALTASVRSQTEKVDVFIHNAASGVLRNAAELSRRHWDWTHNINVRSFFFLVQSLISEPALMGDGGRILALSSLGATRAIPQYSAVGTSKAALESAVRHLASELGTQGITANVISPGVIDTWSLKQFPNREQLLEIATLRTPMGRLTTAHDVADVAEFLWSPNASMISGQTIHVDGGYSALG